MIGRSPLINPRPRITPGFVPFSISSGYYHGDVPGGTYSAATPSTSAIAYFGFFPIVDDAVISALGVYLSTGQTGAEARLGVYSNVNGKPGTLIADFGTVDLSGSAGMVEAVGSLNISKYQGGVWLCVWMKNVATQATVICAGGTAAYYPMTAAQIGAASNIRGYSATAAYPANLPATAPTTATFVSAMPMAWVKIA